MRKLLTIFGFIMLTQMALAQSGPVFSEHFENKTMRIDFFHGGDKYDEWITLDQVYRQPLWAGPVTNLIDPFNLGTYYIKIYDVENNQLLFSRGYNSYFGEYQTTADAAGGKDRTYHETARIPYPKKNILFTVESRDSLNVLHRFFEQVIDPGDVNIIAEAPDADIQVFDILNNGDVHKKVDMLFVAEGYTLAEAGKLKTDLQHFVQVFLDQEPYKSKMNHFNIRAVFKPSDESGVDEPTHGVFKNTPVNATFNSMGSPRYLLTEDNRALQDVASAAPYDALLILVNHPRYGGGGIYNFFATFTSDNDWRDYVFIHEFGHSFAGLADEYYSSATAYDSFYPVDIEPLEVNITALKDPDNLKWKQLIEPDTPLPTPWHKSDYDAVDQDYQTKRQAFNHRIAKLKREHADSAAIAEVEKQAALHSRKSAQLLDSVLRQNRFWNKVGAFEGAGYVSEGLYRPMLDCIMFSKGMKPYCAVCGQGIKEMIAFYADEPVIRP